MSGQEAKEKGNAAFKSGDFVEAIGHYTAAILADPKNATYPLNRAAAYLKLGKNEDAERDCTRVIELDGKNVKGWFRRGQARAALSRLEDAKKDFERVLQLEPKNDAAQQEVKKVAQAILERNAKLKKKTPLDIGSSSSSASNTRRRRVPITIIDSDPSPPSSSQKTVSISASEDLLQPVSSRKLEEPKPEPSSSSTAAPATETSTNRNSATKKPATFKEAKQAREAQQSRPGGGIFRRDGQHTIFDTCPKPPSSATPVTKPETSTSPAPQTSTPPTTKPTDSKPIPEPTKPRPIPSLVAAASSMTLFNFNRNWDSLKSPEARWEFLEQIPPASLPSLFKASLEASNLVSIIKTFQHILQTASPTPETKNLIQEYLVNLARVSRFNTLVLFLSADERRLAREVWTATEDGVVSDAPERKAWGLV